MEWTNDRVSELIGLYSDHPCLYNTKHKEYHNRDLRSKAMDMISTTMGFTGEPLVYSREEIDPQVYTATIIGIHYNCNNLQ